MATQKKVTTQTFPEKTMKSISHQAIDDDVLACALEDLSIHHLLIEYPLSKVRKVSLVPLYAAISARHSAIRHDP